MGMSEWVKIPTPSKICSGFSLKVVIYIKTFTKVNSYIASISWFNFASSSSHGPSFLSAILFYSCSIVIVIASLTA